MKIRKNRPKLAIFHNEFFFSGGAEKLIFQDLDLFKNLGIKAECWAGFIDKKRSFPKIIEHYPVFSLLPNWPIPAGLKTILAILTIPFWARRFVGYNFIIGANFMGMWLAAGTAWFLKKPYWLYLPYANGWLYPRKIDIEFGQKNYLAWQARKIFLFLNPWIRFLDKQIVLGAKAVLANGSYAQKVLTKIYKRQIINCPAGIKVKKSIKTKANQSFFLKNPYILSVNRLVPKKRIDWLIELMPLVWQKNGKVDLIIVGQGDEDYQQQLKSLAKKIGLSKRENKGKIIFQGYVDEKKLTALYQQAVVFVYPAPQEDFGIGLIEAAGFGLPHVAWDKAGPVGIVKHGQTGYLAKSFSQNDFADKIVRILKLSDKNYQAMSQKALKLAKTDFSITKRKAIWKKVLAIA